MNPQIAAIIIFVVMFIFIIADKIERHLVTLASGAATLIVVFGIMMKDLSGAWQTIIGINWETILFIAGMMIMVEGMARAGFFRWLCVTIAETVHYRIIPVFVSFMLLAAFLAMFIDSITVIMFLAAITTELAQRLNYNPVPLILSEIFFANLGGAATMCGDPPNIIIGTALGYSFGDFFINTGVIVAIAMVFSVPFFYLCFRKELGGASITEPAEHLRPSAMIENKKRFVLSVIIFLLAVVMLATHGITEIPVSVIGLFIGALTLLASPGEAVSILKKTDYKLLLFFIGLFVVVGGLEHTGVLEILAGFIGRVSGGNLMIMTAIIIWTGAIASAIVDNIPFAATMVPVIKSLAYYYGVDMEVLAWSLAMGTDIGGSATPIGGSANVVGISIADSKGYHVTWGKYCKYMVPASLMVIFISTIVIWIRYI